MKTTVILGYDGELIRANKRKRSNATLDFTSPDLLLIDAEHVKLLSPTKAKSRRSWRQLFKNGLKIIGGLIVVWLLLAGVMFIGRDKENTTRSHLQSYGITTQAQITSNQRERDGEDSFSYYILYRFQTSQAVTYTGEQYVSIEEYQRLGIGMSIMIRYLPWNPSVSRFADRTAETVGDVLLESLMPVVVVTCGVSGLLILLICDSSSSEYAKIKGLVKRGAQVIRGEFLMYQSDSLGHYICYTFIMPNGGRYTSRKSVSTDTYKRLAATGRLKAGAPVAILYLTDTSFILL